MSLKTARLMSTYSLQKLIFNVNRNPAVRDEFMRDAEAVISRYDLTEIESDAVRRRNWAKLYELGVHGLLLRPFSILHTVCEADYLRAIREVS